MGPWSGKSGFEPMLDPGPILIMDRDLSARRAGSVQEEEGKAGVFKTIVPRTIGKLMIDQVFGARHIPGFVT